VRGAHPGSARPHAYFGGPHQALAAFARCRPGRPGPGHARFFRGRSGKPRQRSRLAGRQGQQGPRGHGRFRARQGQGAHGQGAPQPHPLRRGEADHRLSRGRSRACGQKASRYRSRAQGFHYPARYGARDHHAAAHRRPAQLFQGFSPEQSGRAHGRPGGRGTRTQPDDHRCRQRHRTGHHYGP